MRVFRNSNKTSLSDKFNIGKIIIIVIIAVQLILNGVFLYALNSKVNNLKTDADNLTKGSVENFGNLRQTLNQVLSRQSQLQTEIRRMRAW